MGRQSTERGRSRTSSPPLRVSGAGLAGVGANGTGTHCGLGCALGEQLALCAVHAPPDRPPNLFLSGARAWGWRHRCRATERNVQVVRARLGRGAAFAGVAFPFPDTGEGALATESAALAAVRGGVSLYLESFAVATMVSGLRRLAAPRSLRRRCTASRMRSFCVTAPLVAAALSHFASSSAIRTDFGVKVVSAIGSLCGGRWS